MLKKIQQDVVKNIINNFLKKIWEHNNNNSTTIELYISDIDIFIIEFNDFGFGMLALPFYVI